MRLESNDHSDPQAPDDQRQHPGFSRPVLRFQVALRDEPPLTEVFVTHLKSKLPTRIDQEPWFDADPDLYRPHATALGAALSTIRRTAEATALRVLLTDGHEGHGDPGDRARRRQRRPAQQHPQHPHRAAALPGGRLPGGADIGLYTAQTLQEYRDTRDVYYTHVHEDLRESLDHVLVSEQFYDNSRRRLWLFDGLVINNDHLDDEDHRLTGTGDHGVVRVRFAVAARSADPR